MIVRVITSRIQITETTNNIKLESNTHTQTRRHDQNKEQAYVCSDNVDFLLSYELLQCLAICIYWIFDRPSQIKSSI